MASTRTAPRITWPLPSTPAGARVYDVEFYLYNSAAVTLYGITWESGEGGFNGYWLQNTHAANATLHAARFVIPSSLNGPFPHGTRIGVSLQTPTNASVQINGVRLGLKSAPLGTVLRQTPLRVYDSRQHSPLSSGHHRTISLTGHVPPGAYAAVLAFTTINTHGKGEITAGPSLSKAKTPIAIWARTGDRQLNEVTVPLSSTASFTVLGHQNTCDFAVDLLGYLI